MSESNLEQVIEAVKSLSPAEQQTLRERLSEGERIAQPVNRDDLAERGQRLYDEHLKMQLEPEHKGRFVAVEPDSGKYFLGDTGTAALVAASTALPEKKFYLLRIGYAVTHRVGGHGLRIRRGDK